MAATTEVPTNIATISSGFEKGDFLVREEQGKRLYFDFFEDAFNYVSGRGFKRMSKEKEKEWVELLHAIHESVIEGGLKYNCGNLVMVLSRPVKMAQQQPSMKIASVSL